MRTVSRSPSRALPPTVLSFSAVASAALVGGYFGPQEPGAAAWYLSLRKPLLTPPGPAIGGIWLTLYTLLGFAGARLLRAPDLARRNAALSGWGATIAGIALFPYMFFGRKKLGGSAIVSAGMLAAATTAAATSAKVDRTASLCFAPVAIWVALATVLSEELWRRNER